MLTVHMRKCWSNYRSLVVRTSSSCVPPVRVYLQFGYAYLQFRCTSSLAVHTSTSSSGVPPVRVYLQFGCTYLQFGCAYLQFGCAYLQFACTCTYLQFGVTYLEGLDDVVDVDEVAHLAHRRGGLVMTPGVPHDDVDAERAQRERRQRPDQHQDHRPALQGKTGPSHFRDDRASQARFSFAQFSNVRCPSLPDQCHRSPILLK